MTPLGQLRTFPRWASSQTQRAAAPSMALTAGVLAGHQAAKNLMWRPNYQAVGLWNNIPAISAVAGSTGYVRNGPHSHLGVSAAFFQPLRCASGGGAKGGESAKEKRLRRLLKKLNPNAAKREDLGETDAVDPEWGGARQQKRSGADRERTLEELDAAAGAAQQKMQKLLQQLETKLKELQVARPQLEMFENIQVHISGSTKKLAELGQVVIRGTSVARLTLFSGQHLSKVVSALRKTDESWAIVEEGPTTVRVQLPRMSEDLRSTFASKAKAATEECKMQIRRVRQESRTKLHSLLERPPRLEDSMKREKEQELQKLTDEAIKQASNLLNGKLKQVATPAD